MNKVINGKIYSTDTATEVYSESVYHNGNYAGSDDLMKSNRGNFFIWEFSNGQDLYRDSDIVAISKSEAIGFLEGRILNDEERDAIKREFGLEEA